MRFIGAVCGSVAWIDTLHYSLLLLRPGSNSETLELEGSGRANQNQPRIRDVLVHAQDLRD